MGSNGTAVEARISYDAFGQVGREEAPDGTITRTTRGMRGRIERVYRGTQDLHLYWGTREPCPPPNIDPDCDEDAGDNMVLTEKWYYGEGVRDAGKVVAQRRYRQRPVNQYFASGGEPPPPANNEDEIGLETEYQYDRRMRQVYAEDRSAAGAGGTPAPQPLHYMLTWLDHRDRPRFLAEYDPDASGSGPDVPTDPAVDPRAFALFTPLPTAAMILQATDPPPLSLKEALYDRAGPPRRRASRSRTCRASTPATEPRLF